VLSGRAEAVCGAFSYYTAYFENVNPARTNFGAPGRRGAPDVPFGIFTLSFGPEAF
jgi:hypothetical protein